MPVENKKFNGKLYYRNSNWKRKSDAIQRARLLQSSGGLAQTVKTTDVFGKTVYQVWEYDKNRDAKIKEARKQIRTDMEEMRRG